MSEYAAIPERYEVISELASGAQGTVLHARDLRSGQDVAIKQFLGGARTAYLRELAASLDNRHANLLTPLDTFYGADGVGFVVYEFLDAGNLRQSLTPGEAMPTPMIIRCAEDLFSALAHLHERKLIHCDIKPENVFIRHCPPGHICAFLLGDLGSTCSIREAEQGEHRTGSPAYIAPERLFQKFQPNSDLYSVGVLLFELSTGGLPFTGGPKAMARAHLQQPVPLEQVSPAWLRSLIGGLMEKDPSRRISSAKRALRMLSSASAEGASVSGDSLQVDSHVDPKTNPKQLMLKQANIARRPPTEVARTTLEPGFDRLHVVGAGDGPVLLVESASDFATVPLMQQSWPRMFAKSGNLRLLNHDSVLYQSESSINLLDLSSRTSSVVHDRCVGAIDFACDGQRLLWRTRRSVHRIDLRTRVESSFLLPHYLLEARSQLLPNGSFVVSSGAMGLALRGADDTLIAVHDLDGPTIDLVNDLDTLLALTLNVKQADRYALWRISEYSKPQRLEIPGGSRFFTSTPGHVFWLVDGVQIVQCGIGLAPREVFKAPEPIDGFAIAPDHQWLVTWVNANAMPSQIRIYSTENISETVPQ